MSFSQKHRIYTHLSDLSTLTTKVFAFLTITKVFVVFSLLRTLALIKPDVLNKMGSVLDLIYSFNLIVTKALMTQLTW